jgi:hypothetical protein
MARRYFQKRHHKKHSMTIPIAIVAGFIPPAVGVWDRRSDPKQMGNFALAAFTGIDNGRFNPAALRYGALPVAAGFLAHKIASRLGVNRALASAGIPLIRI